uniref:uncharacterized protein LOC120341685 n=1 Tax=Styela clava TaxID=7725 RepID=UPI00193A5851|nr:uncharacterized protein LOC120341685 [Styela clava]
MKIQDGFEWRDGSIPRTLGICVWPEVFYVEKDGRKVEVMIVDTQGLFSSSLDTDVNIMSISALLSSHQILNIQKYVGKTDLEHLQLSLEYALAASRSFPMKEKSFQKLTIVARDWSFSFVHGYGYEGGDKYVDKVLKTKDSNQSERVSQVKISIHSGFEHVNEFLMSRPSEEIYGGERSQDIRNADITGEFGEQIIMLVDSVLNPENLVVKKMFGQPISTNDLINLISEVGNNIESGKQPKIETLLESATKANNATALQEAVSKYRCHLKQIKSSFPSDDELHGHHEKVLKVAEEVFHSVAILGSEIQNKAVWNHVKKECEMLYKNKEDEISLRKAEKIEKLRTKADEIEKKYEDKMNKLAMDISFEKLEVKYAEYNKEALGGYEVSADDLRAILWEDGDPIKEQLKTRMETFFKQAHQQRMTFQAKQKLIKEKEQLEMQKAARDCLKAVQQKMQLISGEFISKMEEVCKKEKRSILQRYDRHCGGFTDRDEVKKCRNILEDKLAEHFEKADKNNKRNMEMLKSKCAEHSQTAAREYDEKMKNLMGQNQSHEEEFLAMKHSEFKKNAMYSFDDLLKSMSFSPSVSVENEFKMKLDLAMNLKYQVYKKKNDRERMIQKMEKESKECARHAKTALGVYTQDMDQLLENGKTYSELGLLWKHETCDSKALREFRNLTANVTCSQRNFRENLMKEIEEKFSQYRQMNSKNHDEEKQKHIKTLTDEYEASMKEWAEHYSPGDEVLEIRHNKMLVDLLKKFSELMNAKETAEDKEELEKGINGVYLKIEAENKKNRDEREFLERQKELNMRSLQISSEIGRHDFFQRMRIKSYENIHEENFLSFCHSTQLEVLEEFNEETENLGDSLKEKILEERTKLERTVEGFMNEEIERNRDRRKIAIDNAVKACIWNYREFLNELMLKAYVTTSGFEMAEQWYIDILKGKEKIKKLLNEKIRMETEEAKIQNEENKDHRSVIADGAVVEAYIENGVLTLTFFGKLRALIKSAAIGVVKLKNIIKNKITSRRSAED